MNLPVYIGIVLTIIVKIIFTSSILLIEKKTLYYVSSGI